MSDGETSNSHHFDPFQYYFHHDGNFSGPPSSSFPVADPFFSQDLIDPNIYANVGSEDYLGVVCSSSDAMSTPVIDDNHEGMRKVTETNSPVSAYSVSDEAAVTEEADHLASSGKGSDNQLPGCGDDDADQEKLKKASKPKKEKRQKEPRFAFVTKSKIDNLEDGYRWRKHGQKAVKNSPYPRNYYRCTTQKCAVKKRVERSFQDPATVITTYEGRHNHLCPSALRANAAAAAAILPSSFFQSSASMAGLYHPHKFLVHQVPIQYNDPFSRPTLFYGKIEAQEHEVAQLQLPDHDHGLLQDMVPSMFEFHRAAQ